MIRLSAIIPTRNRDRYLINAVESLLAQTLENDAYEILVIDNASSDGTMQKVASLIESNINRIRYFYAEEPGLHVCRHLAARKAKGEIVTFTDDDIIAYDGWLEAIVRRFQDSNIALVGGKILPKWEGEVPDWIELFRNKTKYGWNIGHLSLLDLGNSSREIPTKYVWGCNFSIRKPVLFECGGFHPDGMPQDLIRYRGDGETGLCNALREKGYKAFYEPKALIYHRVPSERLTIEYFCRRAFNQGVSDSYTEIRRNREIVAITPNRSPKGFTLRTALKKLKSLAMRLFLFRKSQVPAQWRPILRQVAEAHERGMAYHREQVIKDSELLPYILKKHYF